MASNVSGKFKVPVEDRTHENNMEMYDILPKEYREVISNAPYNLIIKELPPLEKLKVDIEFITRESVRATYGNDHPQSL